jgi:hypothetical protein
VIRAAFERSNDRVWSAVRPLCIEALGSEVVVDTLGTDTCIHGVMNVAKAADLESTRDAMREVAETRAGERPAPTPGPTRHPVFELFWTLTGEMAALEADLTRASDRRTQNASPVRRTRVRTRVRTALASEWGSAAR